MHQISSSTEAYRRSGASPRHDAHCSSARHPLPPCCGVSAAVGVSPGVGPWPYRHVLVRLRNLLIHLLASRPATRSEGVTRSVSSPPVALRLAARCMSLLLLLSFPRVASAGGKKRELPSHRRFMAVVCSLICSPSLLRGRSLCELVATGSMLCESTAPTRDNFMSSIAFFT